jgi:hypothetical protein
MPDTSPKPKVGVRRPGEALSKELQTKVLKASAVQAAMFEIIQENRSELIRRARAKLKAFGIEVPDEELVPRP